MKPVMDPILMVAWPDIISRFPPTRLQPPEIRTIITCQLDCHFGLTNDALSLVCLTPFWEGLQYRTHLPFLSRLWVSANRLHFCELMPFVASLSITEKRKMGLGP